MVVNPRAAGRAPRLAPLPRARAAKALAEQTLGVRLFDRDLHARHLEWLAAMVSGADCYLLDYPHDRAQWPAVGSALDALQGG